MFISTSLMHYKRQGVQKGLVDQATDKEVGVMFGASKFGKRPDVLVYENDVMELAKRKVTSFHCSEETWSNPLLIKSGLSRKDLNELRIGWDLILDIDCPDWPFSKLITHLFVKALSDHGIKSISVKFSGNKGFHIAVPFESFPKQTPFKDDEGNMFTRDVKDLFPEAPRKIATYLLSYITSKYSLILENSVDFDGHVFSFDYLNKISAHSSQSLISFQCVDCKSFSDSSFQKPKTIYRCSKCGHESHPNNNPDVVRCEKCSHPVTFQIIKSLCSVCGSSKTPKRTPNLSSVVEVDTVLISSRHLYRMPYSLHEKSGLASIPIFAKDILTFEKSQAQPSSIVFDVPFLDRSKAIPGEASKLFLEAFEKTSVLEHKSFALKKDIPIPENALPEEFFPPCIKLILEGLEDGKKRALFVLINFLRVSGWSKDQIQERLKIWNKENAEPLKEQYIKGQLYQIKKGKAPLPPPNCSNHDYYKSLLICKPDSFCSKINNPAMYAKRKQEMDAAKKPKAKKKKSTPKKPKKISEKVEKSPVEKV